MRALLYHDVAPRSDWPRSGFEGGDAHVYKLEPGEFEGHLASLASIGRAPALASAARGPADWLLTFDDGGESAVTRIAPALERRGWRGHFFITLGRLDTSGFVDAAGVRRLAAAGHVVGSHSVRHPLAMSSWPRDQLVAEWKESVDLLADVLGKRPETASIPGGAFSRDVALAAGEAGIRFLFTSEPRAGAWQVGDVTCFGRFTVWNHMPPSAALGFATGRGSWPIRQRALWETKKLAKNVLGERYHAIRRRMLAAHD
jgi:peptidoglycan/xylan/chitin deacetylase (PgdA/CDA1 family)